MRYILFFFAFIIAVQVSGQKFGKIDDAMVMQEKHPLEPEAEAAYLFSKCDIEYDYQQEKGFSLFLNYHYRIKVYSEKGESYADFKIPFYHSKKGKERVRGIKAYTYNYENGKVVKEELDKDNVFEEETSENWKQTKFAMPNVKPGSVIEVKYFIESPFIYTLPRWFFQNYIPTDKSEFIVSVPEYFTYTLVPSGSLPVEKIEKAIRNQWEGNYYQFNAEAIPSIKKDEYVLDIDDYRSGMKYELASVSLPGASPKNYSQDWNSIANNLLDHKKFGDQLGKNFDEIKPIIAQTEAMGEIEKMAHIYRYVQSSYTWNENYGVYCDDGLKNLVKTKTGDIAEINLLLVNTLVKAGLKARPMVTKSRFSGLLNTMFPTVTELNYVLAEVYIDNKSIILDASSKYVTPGLLPIRACNINGVVLDKEGGKLFSLKNPNLFKSQQIGKYTVDAENECLRGDLKLIQRQYAAVKYRIDANKEDDEDDQDFIVIPNSDEEKEEEESEDDDLEDEVKIDNIFTVVSVDTDEAALGPITVNYRTEKYNCIKWIDDKIFIDADLAEGINKNKFTQETRDYPVFFNNLYDIKTNCQIDVPENYVVESVPEDLKLVLPGDKGRFYYEIKHLEEKLLVNYTLLLKTDIFLPSDYPSLKEFLSLVTAKENEKIIFTPEQ